jgi:hypothetical protein
MPYDHVPPEVSSTGSTDRPGDPDEPELPCSGTVTIIDVDDDGNVTKVAIPIGDAAP